MYKDIECLPNNFKYTCTFFDLETTGLDLEKDRIIQYSSKSFSFEQDYDFTKNPSRVDIVNHIVNPKMKVSSEILNLTGINKEDIDKGVEFKDIASDIRTNFLNTRFLLGYRIRQFDIPLIQKEFQRAMMPLNFKHSNNVANTSILFIDIYDIIEAELKSNIHSWCRENNLPVNIKLSTVYDFITNEFSNALGYDLKANENQQFHNAMFDVNATIRILIGLIKLFNVNVLDYTTTFYNVKNYKLNYTRDKDVVITKKGNYKNMTLKELVEDTNSRSKRWLLTQHDYNNITLDSELITKIQESIV